MLTTGVRAHAGNQATGRLLGRLQVQPEGLDTPGGVRANLAQPDPKGDTHGNVGGKPETGNLRAEKLAGRWEVEDRTEKFKIYHSKFNIPRQRISDLAGKEAGIYSCAMNKKKYEAQLRRLEKFPDLSEHERILFAMSLSASPTERWKRHENFLRSHDLFKHSRRQASGFK